MLCVRRGSARPPEVETSHQLADVGSISPQFDSIRDSPEPDPEMSAPSGRGGRMTTTLDGKVAVITGATRGCGRGIAVELGALGATVYVTGRTTRDNRSPMN